jgi:hypothetical protein
MSADAGDYYIEVVTVNKTVRLYAPVGELMSREAAHSKARAMMSEGTVDIDGKDERILHILVAPVGIKGGN